MKNIRIKLTPERASGNRKSWFKHVTGVDTSKTSGYAFEGTFLDAGEHDLPLGAVVVEQQPSGSVKNWSKEYLAYRVGESGALEPLHGGSFHYKREFLSFRDLVVAALGQSPNPLADVSDEALVAECRRRGLTL